MNRAAPQDSTAEARGSTRPTAVVARGPLQARIRSALDRRRTVVLCEQLAALPQEARPEVAVLCAASLEARPGELVEDFLKRHPDVPAVVVLDVLEARGVRSALAAGACGLVAGEALAEALEPCLNAVVAGQVCVPLEHWRQARPPVLSMREKQVLSLLVMGYMNGQIAEQLFLAESTVKSHLHTAFGKLGVRSRNEAVDAILDPQRGLGLGILGVGAEPLPIPSGAAV